MLDPADQGHVTEHARNRKGQQRCQNQQPDIAPERGVGLAEYGLTGQTDQDVDVRRLHLPQSQPGVGVHHVVDPGQFAGLERADILVGLLQRVPESSLRVFADVQFPARGIPVETDATVVEKLHGRPNREVFLT